MKKFILGALALVMCFSLTACGNFKFIDTSWEFNYAYITLPEGETLEVEIDSWTEDSSTVTIKSKDNVYCIAPINCLMTKNKL